MYYYKKEHHIIRNIFLILLLLVVAFVAYCSFLVFNINNLIQDTKIQFANNNIMQAANNIEEIDNILDNPVFIVTDYIPYYGEDISTAKEFVDITNTFVQNAVVPNSDIIENIVSGISSYSPDTLTSISLLKDKIDIPLQVFVERMGNIPDFSTDIFQEKFGSIKNQIDSYIGLLDMNVLDNDNLSNYYNGEYDNETFDNIIENMEDNNISDINDIQNILDQNGIDITLDENTNLEYLKDLYQSMQ